MPLFVERRMNDKDVTRGQALKRIVDSDKVTVAWRSDRGIEVESKGSKEDRDPFIKMVRDKPLERIIIEGSNGIEIIWNNDVNDLVGHWFIECEEEVRY